jgi:hypothetical protein
MHAVRQQGPDAESTSLLQSTVSRFGIVGDFHGLRVIRMGVPNWSDAGHSRLTGLISEQGGVAALLPCSVKGRL